MLVGNPGLDQHGDAVPGDIVCASTLRGLDARITAGFFGGWGFLMINCQLGGSENIL